MALPCLPLSSEAQRQWSDSRIQSSESTAASPSVLLDMVACGKSP